VEILDFIHLTIIIVIFCDTVHLGYSYSFVRQSDWISSLVITTVAVIAVVLLTDEFILHFYALYEICG